MTDDFGDGMEEGGWASLPHGTVVRVLKHRISWLVIWVNQVGNWPSQAVTHYPVDECSDELSAYMRFAKEMEDGRDGAAEG